MISGIPVNIIEIHNLNDKKSQEDQIHLKLLGDPLIDWKDFFVRIDPFILEETLSNSN